MGIYNLLKKLSLFSLILISSCSSSDSNHLYGYIEGEYTYVASGIAGTLLKLDVKRGQPVKENDLLFVLDPQPDKAAMEAAKANVEQLQAEVDLAKIVLRRYQDLFIHHATDENTRDEKQTDYDTKVKQLQSAEKNLIESNWAYQQKTIYSPSTGHVFDTFYRVGEKVAANQPVLAILTPDNVKVLFYIPEKQLSLIHLGQTIHFTCDGCTTSTQATISYISPEAEYTPPIIYSENTRNTLVYLVRADMSTEVAQQYHPGQPLDIYLHE